MINWKDEDWTADREVHVTDGAGVYLKKDRSIAGLAFDSSDSRTSIVDLLGHRLIVGGSGIRVNPSYRVSFMLRGGGTLTSSTHRLSFFLNGNSDKPLSYMYLCISDNGHGVGLELITAGGVFRNGISLLGNRSNTFTGAVNLKNSILELAKDSGAVAISSLDINVIDGSELRISKSHQINDKARALLRNNSEISFFSFFRSSIEERFGALVVEGSNVLSFNSVNKNIWPRGRRAFYIDDIYVTENSFLTIQEWLEGRDLLLVKKGAEHLEESLKRIEFEGYNRNNIHLNSYDSEYWWISALPEPGVYGAAFTGLGLGFFLYRKCWRRAVRPAPFAGQ